MFWFSGESRTDPPGKSVSAIRMAIPETVSDTRDGSAVTSGSYERYFVIDGRRYSHIIDPFTGRPVSNNLKSVTVFSSSSAEADALATGFFVLGLERSLDLLEEMPGVRALFVDTDRKIHLRNGVKFRRI